MSRSPIELLVIVPARSGSKGIPGKNIKPLGGIPLLAWTARAIQAAAIENSLAILSTDSKEIAETGQQFGLEVPFLRPEAISEDNSSANQVIQHSLEWFEQHYQYAPKMLMWLQPTSPFRKAKHIQQAYELMQSKQTQAVIGCQTIYRDETTLFHLNQGYLKSLSQDKKSNRRQEVATLLTPNGIIYMTYTDSYKKLQSFYPENTVPLICDKISSIDIDTEEDWLIAESLINNHHYDSNE